jgi:uncharacterized BrkB/YihY/UPF0761 family membrane protein
MLRERLETATEAAEARRSDSVWYDAGFKIWDRNRVLPASVLVGAMASRIVIYLIPLFALVIFSFGLYEDVGDQTADQAARSAGMPALFAEAAGDSVDLNDGVRFFAVVATIWATLYAANTLGRLMRRSAAFVWGVPYTKLEKPWKLPLVVIGLTLVGWAITGFGSAVDDWTVSLWVGVIIIEFIALTVFWLLLSRWLPRDPEANRWSDLFPGSIFVAVGIVLLRLAMLVYFAPAVAALTARYGSIAIGLVMLTWAFWVGMIMVGSVEINAAIFRSRKTHGRR